jgi:adenine deaminase
MKKFPGSFRISGNLIDIHKREIYPATITISEGIVEKIEKVNSVFEEIILPGLIDAHVHIESSMVTPGAFAVAAVCHGTTAVVSDPHEIANVMGSKGVDFMIDDSKKVPLKFNFGAPSCVPATEFETSGAVIRPYEITKMLDNKDIKYLSEMMNFPGVVFSDKDVMAKIHAARERNKPIDGHAPGLRGEMLQKYVAAGISTDHECSSIDEALEKIKLGMNIIIREGSAARNLDALKDLFVSHPDKLMLCSDDLHPEMLQKGHINVLIAKLITEGYNIFDVIRSATINPVHHYGLSSGLLRRGDPADFISVTDLKTMKVSGTWIDGKKVYDNGKVLFTYEKGQAVNNFHASPITKGGIKVLNEKRPFRVISAVDGELLTGQFMVNDSTDDYLEADVSTDILKIVVKNRYSDTPPSVAFISGFGLKYGAFASSIAHDSHNIIAVGTNDSDIVNAINSIIELKGGLSVTEMDKKHILQLNIGGIMSDDPCSVVAAKYEGLNKLVKSMGCKMKAPFMTLSFMALLVIPELKIGDKGLFDVRKFSPVTLFGD